MCRVSQVVIPCMYHMCSFYPSLDDFKRDLSVLTCSETMAKPKLWWALAIDNMDGPPGVI